LGKGPSAERRGYVIVAGTLSGLAAVPAAEGLAASSTRLPHCRPALRRPQQASCRSHHGSVQAALPWF